MRNVVIIVDGNHQIGMGHVYQAKTFANYCKDFVNNVSISFLTKSSRAIADLIRAEGYEVISCKNDLEICEHLTQKEPAVIIVDKLDFAPYLAKKIKETFAAKLAIFTCITEANRYADITVMGAMGSHFKNTKELINEGKTLSFHGPRYLILRPEFFRPFPVKPTFSGKVLLLLGGADPANITCSAIKTLLDSNERYHIKTIIGSAFKNKKDLEYLTTHKQSLSLVEIIENTTKVSDYMEWADVAIVSPGISFFESLKTKTPVIVFNQNQFQHDAWSTDMTTFDKEDIFMLPHLMRERGFVYPDDKRVTGMDIGNGVKELIQTILE